LKPLLVGQAPNSTGDPSLPLTGAVGRRLMGLLGVNLYGYVKLFDRANLIREFPGKAAKGDLFPPAVARENAARMLPGLAGRPFAVLLGRGVASAFGVGAEFLREETVAGVRFFVAPHPSSVNLWWNDAANVRRARRFFRRIERLARRHRRGLDNRKIS
jgi:uracil-DNA glycosylase